MRPKGLGLSAAILIFLFMAIACRGPGTVNNPPWPITQPALPEDIPTASSPYDSFPLEIKDGEGMVITNPLFFDPEGLGVTFIVELITSGTQAYSGPEPPPSASAASDGTITASWTSSHVGYQAYFNVSASDGVNVTGPSVIGINIWDNPP